MLELYFLLFRVPASIRRAAKPRGKNPFVWALAASGAWLLTELAALAVLLTIVWVLQTYAGWHGDLGIFYLLLYLGPLTLGMLACERVKAKLAAFPVTASTAGSTPNLSDRC